jgi:hypothetical protein
MAVIFEQSMLIMMIQPSLPRRWPPLPVNVEAREDAASGVALSDCIEYGDSSLLPPCKIQVLNKNQRKWGKPASRRPMDVANGNWCFRWHCCFRLLPVCFLLDSQRPQSQARYRALPYGRGWTMKWSTKSSDLFLIDLDIIF